MLTGVEMPVGEAQWNTHFRKGNLVRYSDDIEVMRKLRNDHRLALPAPGLFAYENEQGLLVFETTLRDQPRRLIKRNNIVELAKAFLLREPTLPASTARDRMLAVEPRVQIMSDDLRDGIVVIY